MRTLNYYKLLFFIVVLSGGGYFASCVDKDVDLENISGDLYFKGHYEVPVIKKSTVKMSEIVKQYGGAKLSRKLEDGVFDETTDDYVCLWYDRNYTYYDVNGGFQNLKNKINAFSVIIPVVKGQQSVTQTITFESIKPDVSQGDDHDIRRLDLLEDVTVTVTPVTGITFSSIQIGNKTPISLNNNSATIKELILNKGESIKVNFSGPANANANVRIGLKFNRYVVYGYFFYKREDEEKSTGRIGTDLRQYLVDSNFDFMDPRFEFTVTNKNMGVPLYLNAKLVVSNENDLNTMKRFVFESGKDIGNPFALLNYPKVLNETPAPADVTHEINKDKAFVKNKDKYSELIHSQLESVRALYDIGSRDPLPDEAIRQRNEGLQFVDSKGSVSVRTKAVLPFWIKKGMLKYVWKLNDVDVSDLNDDEHDIVIDESSNVTIRLDYVNNLPFEMSVDSAKVFDSAGNLLFGDVKGDKPLKRAEYKKDSEFKMADRISEGKGKVDIVLKHKHYTLLKNAKKVNIELVFSDKTRAQAKDEQIRVRASHTLEIGVGIIIDGAATYSEK